MPQQVLITTHLPEVPHQQGRCHNYLIPQGKAILATPSAKKVLAENLKQRAHKLAKIKADAEELAAK
ncbi:MAG: 50S ribosomal protein L9, partial [Bacteroidales bacterium]|nr:50S ribosomal protein L9 [Bacteroidales bacterium]